MSNSDLIVAISKALLNIRGQRPSKAKISASSFATMSGLECLEWQKRTILSERNPKSPMWSKMLSKTLLKFLLPSLTSTWLISLKNHGMAKNRIMIKAEMSSRR